MSLSERPFARARPCRRRKSGRILSLSERPFTAARLSNWRFRRQIVYFGAAVCESPPLKPPMPRQIIISGRPRAGNCQLQLAPSGTPTPPRRPRPRHTPAYVSGDFGARRGLFRRGRSRGPASKTADVPPDNHFGAAVREQLPATPSPCRHPPPRHVSHARATHPPECPAIL